MSAEEIFVPEMVGFGVLSKIVVASLKVGADQDEKTYSEIATMARVGEGNISLNSKFLTSIGINEGGRGRIKLTPLGRQYAQSLDWGKLDEANKILREILKDKPLTKKVLGYVDMHQPVANEDLVSQIALFAGAAKEPRFETGIRGFIDMLVTCGLLEEDSDSKIVVGKVRTIEVEQVGPTTPKAIDRAWEQQTSPTTTLEGEMKMAFPITITLNVDKDTDITRLKQILETIKQIFGKV